MHQTVAEKEDRDRAPLPVIWKLLQDRQQVGFQEKPSKPIQKTSRRGQNARAFALLQSLHHRLAILEEDLP